MFLANTQTYTGKQRKTALLSLFVLLFSFCSPAFANVTEFSVYSDTLKSKWLIERDLISNRAIIYREALNVAIGIGGFPAGCGPSLSITCDTDGVARSRGLIQNQVDNTLVSGIIRANAIRLILRAANIAPSSNPSGFSDVDGKLAVNYAGYIAKARELQCIRSADTFRPFDYVSEGEYAKMAVCVLASPEGLSSTSLSSAPSQAPTSLTQYPTTPISPTQMIYGSFPTGGNSSYALASDLASLANQVSTLSSSGHAPVTLGSANGLTLSGQQLSLGIASSTTIGSLSSTDWNLFNSKINFTSLSATGLLSYNSATGLFSWTGTTTNIAEGTNLYFTDSRAQNALSGIISTVNGNIATATGNIAALSGNITTLSGAINALNTSVSTLSGSLQSISGTVSAIWTQVTSLSGAISTLQSISHAPVTLGSTNGLTLSGQQISLALASGTTTGALSVADWITFNNKINLTSLSATGPLGYNNITGAFSITPGANWEILSTSGGIVTWVNPGTVSIPVTSVFGRAGAVTAQSGDYNSDQVTEWITNLYFTDSRAQNALSGTILGIRTDLATATGQIGSLNTNVATITGQLITITSNIATATGNIATLSGQIATIGANISTLSGNLATLTTTVNTLSGIVAGQGVDISTLSGQTASNTSSISSLSGTLSSLTSIVNTLSGGLQTLSTTVNALSGQTVANTANIASLSGTLANISNTLITLSGTVSTILTDISTLSGNLNTLSGWLATTNTNVSTLSGSLSSLSWTVSILASQIAALSGQAHDAVTLGSANGLTLSGQQISLALASGTTTGALSVADWIAFNNKINLTSLSVTGGLLSYNSATGLFSWTGTTTNIAEGTNLYFTDSRAQNALSGTILGIRTDLALATGSIVSLSGNLAITNSNLATTNANLATATGNIVTLSGQIATMSVSISTLSGSLATLTTTVNTLSGNLASLSGNLANTDAILSTLSGVVTGLSTNLASLSGSLTNLTTTVNTLSGQTVTNTATINSLSGTVAGISNTLATLSGTINTIITDLASLSGQTVANTANIASNTSNISTLSGSLATTNSNLTALSGSLASLSGTVSALASQIAALSGQAHDAVTLGSANGLTLSGQQISLTLASGTTTGALSVADWIAFNNKINLTSLSGTGFITYNNTTGVIGWTGSTSGITEWANLYWTQSRFDTAFSAKSTTNLTEGTNLYFTDSRAQNALSGTILGIRTDLTTATGNILTLQQNLATATGQINTLNTNVATVIGQLVTINSNIATATWDILSLQANLTTATGNINTLSGQVATMNLSIASLSGSLSSLSSTVNTLSGSLTALTTTVGNLSGSLATLSGQTLANTNAISSLSGNLATTNSTLSSLSGVVSNLSTTLSNLSWSLATLTTTVTSLSGQTVTNTNNIATLSGAIATINTTITALSGSISTLSGSLATTNTNLATLSGTVATLLASSHAPVTLGSANGLTLSGQQLSLTLASSTTTGALSVADWIAFNNKINLTSLSATGGISYNSGTGLFSDTLTFNNGLSRVGNTIGLVNGSNGQVLSMSGGAPTWITLAWGGISSLNGLSSAVQNFAIGSAGTDFTISSTGTTHTFNLPYASASASGLLRSTDFNLFSNKIGFISGAANGLSISGSGISLGLASSTTTGALSATDYLAFSGKLNLTSVLTGFSAASGTITAADSILQAFQKIQGSNTIQDTIISNLGINLATATGNILTLQQNLATATGNIATLFTNLATATGQINNLNTNVATITGQLVTINSNIATATGNILSLQANLATATGNINTLSGQVATLSASSHAPVTLGSANGLTLSGQQISLALASGTTTGALSVADWITFNNKINLTSLSATGLLSYNSGTGLFSWTGTTTNIAEGTNLYFTNARTIGATLTGFSAASGTIVATDTILQAFQKLQGSNTIQDTIISNLGINLATATGNILALQTSLATATGNISTLFTNLATATGQINTLNTNVATITGQLVTINSNIATATGNIATLSGNLATTNTNLNTTNSNLATATGNISTLSWNINTISGNLSSLSGVVATKIGLTSLSANGPLTYNSGTGLFSVNIANSTTTGALSVSDWISFNNRVSFVSGTANGLSISGSGISLGLASSTTTGALSATDYLAFSGKLNLTSVLTGFVAWSGTVTSADSLLSALQKLQGTNTLQDTNIATATGNILGIRTDLATATGNILTLQQNLATATGNIATLSGNLNTLSGVVATKIGLTSLSANGPLTYNSGTGLFSINIANSTTTGALSVADWNAFNNKIGFVSGAANGLSISGSGISLGLASSTTTGALSVSDWVAFNSKLTSLNGLTATGQTFAIGTAGNDFNIVSSGSVHTFNLPDASATARGLVNTGTQVFAGAKTFAVAPTLSGFTQWSVLFAGTGGTIAQDNANIYYNGSTKRLGLGTNAPVATLHNSGSTVLGAITITNRTSSGTIGTAATTVDIATTFNINQTGSNITLSLPTPTSTTAGRIAYVNNIGTTSFFFLGTQIIPNSSRTVIWNGTAWVLTGNADDRISGQYRKLADESIASNIVSQDDDHLSFSVSSGETWFFDISIIVRNGATWGARVQMNVPTGSTNCSNSVITNYNGAWFTNATCNTDIQITNLNNLAATSNSDEFSYRWVFTAGSTGIAKLQWAQRVSNATATIFLKDSTMVVTKLSGADVAEVYYAQDGSIREWEIVSLTGDGISQVKKSDTPYDNSAIGVISTKPGVVMGEADGSGKPVIVGLAGRVPVKVSTKNGDIKPGDYITTSDIPGIGMKATEPGRVIGKALTGLSGESEGTVAVFIQNTYFDGVDEVEYANTLGASGSLGFSSSYALDRFSFMVKKSLTKIDPNFASGWLQTFGSAVSTLAGGVTTISGSVSDLSFQYQTLASDLRILKAQVDAQTGSLFSLSPEYQAVLDSMRSTAGELTVSVRTTFSEAVTFAKSVVFQSDVTIGWRVTFQDRDMAGTATIPAWARSVRVDFSRPYAVTPKITATADDFATFRITDKSTWWFTIEIQEPWTAVSFDWIALHVVWARNTTGTPDESPPTSTGTTTVSGENAPLPDIPTNTSTGWSHTGDTDTLSGSGPPQDVSSSGSSPPVDTSSSWTLTDISTIEPAGDPPLGQTGWAITPAPTVPDPSSANTPPPGDVTTPVTDAGTDTTLAPSATTVVYDDPGNSGSSPPTGPPSTSTDPPTS